MSHKNFICFLLPSVIIFPLIQKTTTGIPTEGDILTFPRSIFNFYEDAPKKWHRYVNYLYFISLNKATNVTNRTILAISKNLYMTVTYFAVKYAQSELTFKDTTIDEPHIYTEKKASGTLRMISPFLIPSPKDYRFVWTQIWNFHPAVGLNMNLTFLNIFQRIEDVNCVIGRVIVINTYNVLQNDKCKNKIKESRYVKKVKGIWYFCGQHSQFSILTSLKNIQVRVCSVQSSSSKVKLLYSVVDKNIIMTLISHKFHNRKHISLHSKFFIPNKNVVLSTTHISVKKYQRLFLQNRKEFTDIRHRIYHGPGFLSHYNTFRSNTLNQIIQVSSFQCVFQRLQIYSSRTSETFVNFLGLQDSSKSPIFLNGSIHNINISFFFTICRV